MHKLNRRLLIMACLASAGLAGSITGVSAATCYGETNCSLGTEAYTFGRNDVFGGGSSVGAPWWRQVSDCYASPADLITAVTPPAFVDEKLFNFNGTHPQNCQTTEINPGPTTWFLSTGSGRGILGFFGHDPRSWGPANEAQGMQYFPELTYALSEAGLEGGDVAAYNAGDSAYCQGSTCINIAAPNQVACNSGSTNPYPNPLQCYGPLVQFPVSVDPLAIVYANGGVYEKVYDDTTDKEIDYKFNVEGGNKHGGLRLSVNSLCGIYNGKITNWNDPGLTADNNGVSLEDPNDPTPAASWSVSLTAVGRSDASGSTLIITRHLAEVCRGNFINTYARGTTTLQDTALKLVINSTGMATYVAFTQSPVGEGNECSSGTVLQTGYMDCIQQGNIGYIGPDYVLPYVSSTQTNSYKLFAASLENHQGEYVFPSPAAALVAFGGAGLPPQTNAKGNYCAHCGTLKRSNPADWNPQAMLGNPAEQGAYPMVGTTNFLGYSCYASAGVLANLLGEANYIETAPINTAGEGIVESSGVAALPKVWRKAIEQTFITNADGLGLQLSIAGSQGTAACLNTSGA